MPDLPYNKYRAAIDILQRGRDLLVESLTDDLLEQRENLLEGGFQFHEFLESHGARLHFLGLIAGHLEQSAEQMDEANAALHRALESPSTAAGKPPLARARKRSRSRNAPYSRSQGESPSDSTGSPDDPPF